MIEIDGLTKVHRSRVAVDDLTVTIEPGWVTGFLGPNGSGKTTTMRCILGLIRPTSGTTTVLGRPYRELAGPMRRVGALLDPRGRHPGRTAHAHLLALAQSNALPRQRVDDVIELVGLESVAHEPVRGFSLGMGQRLGIAGALLGDPDVLLLDEPVNGLDPEGIRWVRELLRSLADEGRTVLVSSHLMSEMEDTADHLVVLGRGRLLADVPMAELLGAHSAVRVRTPQAPVLASALRFAWCLLLTAVLAVVCALAARTLTAVPGGVQPADPDVLRLLCLQVAADGLVGVLSVALGAVLRSTAGVVGVGVALVFVLPPVFALAGGETAARVSQGLPTLRVGEDAFLAVATPWPVGMAIVAAWAAGVWVLGAVLLERRDV